MAESHPPLLIAPPPPGWSGQPVATVDTDRLARRAMVFGIVSFVVNPLFLASIIGIVYGRRALKRGTSRRSEATAGVVTGAVSAALAVLSLAILLPLNLFLQHAADTRLQHGVESTIVSLGARQGMTLTAVSCPAPHQPGAGTVIVCDAQDAAAGPIRVQVTFTSSTTFTAREIQVG